MPILDLRGARPLEGYGKRRQSRTLSPATTSAILNGGSGTSAGGFLAAKVDRLTSDFLPRSRSADQDLFGDNQRLRARARMQAINNPFARKFLAMCAQNVVGPAGILMQAKVRGANGTNTAETKHINQRIEEEWRNWCKPGRCTADGKSSFLSVQLLAVKNCAREGENIVKKLYARSFNSTGFALQLLDNDQLDDTMMTALGNNGAVRMGVEVDQYQRPQAYHFWTSHPNDPIAQGARTRVRVPADQVVHTALWERPAQTRGYTWMSAAILSMNQYQRYEEAVVVAGRSSAAKFMVIQSTVAEGYNPDDDEDSEGNATNMDGTNIMTANAGEAMVLDPGQTANFIDPRFPSNNHKQFTQTILRNVATALLVSYPSLANDLEGVNFSSIRAGLLDERDMWRVLQRWFIESFCEPVFAAWLKMALLTTLNDITLSPKQMEQFEWKARGWDWVDPLKDAQAIVLRLQNGLITYADALANLGLDFEETMTERAAEQAFLEALGITLGTDIRGQADTATDDTMNEQDGEQSGKAGTKPAAGSTGKKGSAAQQAAGKGRTLDPEQIDEARELFRTLRSYQA